MATRDWVHWVTSSYFRSRNKDGGHAMRSAVAENPMLHAHFAALMCYRCGVIGGGIFNFRTAGIQICAGMQVSIAGILDCCRPFLLLWPWLWPNDPRMWTWPVLTGNTPDVQIWTSYLKAFESYCLTQLHHYGKRGRGGGVTPSREWTPKGKNFFVAELQRTVHQ